MEQLTLPTATSMLYYPRYRIGHRHDMARPIVSVHEVTNHQHQYHISNCFAAPRVCVIPFTLNSASLLGCIGLYALTFASGVVPIASC